MMAYLNCAPAISQTNKLTFSGNVGMGIVTKNITLSGKAQSENPEAVYTGNANMSMPIGKGNITLTPLGIYGAAFIDRDTTTEIQVGTYVQTKIITNNNITLNGKITLERKQFPNNEKEMYLTNIILGANTKFGELNVIYREVFNTKDFDSGRTFVLNATTPKLKLYDKNIKINITGTTALSYQDKIIDKLSKFGYLTPGISLGVDKDDLHINAFFKNQLKLRSEIDNYIYGGITASYDIQKK